MRDVLGIDPGPTGYAWARYDGTEITAWGECGLTDLPDTPLHGIAAVGIEKIQWYGPKVPFGNPTRDTCRNIGQIAQMLLFATGREPVEVSRRTVAAGITRLPRQNKQQVNARVNLLCPRFARRRRGLNNHHRDAAAVAVWVWGHKEE